MSIKRNNKQIAGNYVNLNMNIFTEEYNRMIAQLNTIYEQTKEIAESVSNPVGSEKIWRAEVAPSNYIFMEGELFSRETHGQLYEWAVTNNLVVTDDEWQNNQLYGMYSHGDGSTTFRVPNMKGYYLVGYDPEHHTDLCKYQEDTMPNLTGVIDIAGTNDSSPVSTSKTSGVFKINEKEVSSYPITGSTTLTRGNVENIELDISTQVNVGDRIQPKSIPVKYIVCYQDTRKV